MPTTSTTIKKKNSYQKLISRKSSYCHGKATKAAVKQAASVYVADAVRKGKPKAEAQKSANRVLHGGCAMSPFIAKKRKAKKGKRKSRR